MQPLRRRHAYVGHTVHRRCRRQNTLQATTRRRQRHRRGSLRRNLGKKVGESKVSNDETEPAVEALGNRQFQIMHARIVAHFAEAKEDPATD